MIVYEFELADLAQTRFAISPVHELVSGLRLLRNPDRGALHVPWVREALPIARRLDLELALLLAPPKGYMPDFLTPPPSSPVASFEEELEVLRTMSADQVRTDVGYLFDRRRPPEPVRRLVERPRAELKRLTRGLEEFWRLALEPHWPRIRALLEADLAYRSRRLTQGGQTQLFADLHPAVRWNRDRLEVRMKHEATVALRDQGLLLVPSVFIWQKPSAMVDPPWQPTLVYPARGVGLLWEPTPDEPTAGAGRARRTPARGGARGACRSGLHDRPRRPARDQPRRRLPASLRPARGGARRRSAAGAERALRPHRARGAAARERWYRRLIALRETDQPVGAPWERPLAGSLDELVVESELLAGNPLGDPTRRPLYVYRSPGVELDHPKPLPTVYFIQGFTGQIDMVKDHDAAAAEHRRADRRDVRRRRLPRGDRRLRRLLDVLRRLAVPQLGRHRPLPGLPLRRGRPVRRLALSDRAPTAITAG